MIIAEKSTAMGIAWSPVADERRPHAIMCMQGKVVILASYIILVTACLTLANHIILTPSKDVCCNVDASLVVAKGLELKFKIFH